MLTEKEKRIVALIQEGKTVREIARTTNSSFTTIDDARSKAEEEEMIAAQKKSKLEEQKRASEKYTQALNLFSQNKSNVEVAVLTGLMAVEVISIKKDYLKLIGADELAVLYNQAEPYLESLLELHKRTSLEGISQDDLVWALDHSREFRFLKKEINKASAQLEKLGDEIFEAQNELDSITLKRRMLEDIVNSLEKREMKLIEKSESYREFQAIGQELEQL
jgi:transposase